MGLGRQAEQQNAMWISCGLISKSRGHAFFDRLQTELLKSGFDRYVEDQFAPFFYKPRGRRSIQPGRYFRMLLVDYFKGFDSKRDIEWRCADSLSLLAFLLLDHAESVPDHSTFSRLRSRLSLDVQSQVFSFVLALL